MAARAPFRAAGTTSCARPGMYVARTSKHILCAPLRAAGPRYANPVVDTPTVHDDLRARVVSASVLALGRDFCAAFGVATMALGYAQAAGWCDAVGHDRLMVGATDAALAWAVWRAAMLNSQVLQRHGGRAFLDAPHGPDADAGVALAALAWGASGAGLAAAVDAQVQALHIQLLRKDATILSLRKMMEDGGDDNNVDGSKGKK